MFLKSAQRETQWIQAANSKIEWTTLIRPSAQKILRELPKYPLAHFVIHGVSDPKDPSRSHLVLMNAAGSQGPPAPSKTTANHVVRDNLSVPDIFRCTTDNAVLAFLAACCTADVQVATLANENLHIVECLPNSRVPACDWYVVAGQRTCLSCFCKDFLQFARTLDSHQCSEQRLTGVCGSVRDDDVDSGLPE